MKLYGLIGYPLTHSFSKKYFTQKFKTEKINARFVNYEIEDITKFFSIVTQNPMLKGLSVTIPYKERIVPLLDEVDTDALDIGAVNSVKVFTQGSKRFTKGFNTDVYGFKKSLLHFLRNARPTKALILGTGGASKAVAAALRQLELSHTFVSRLKKENGMLQYSELTKELLQSFQLIINTTPLGTYPNISTSPKIAYHHLTDTHFLYDLTYNPPDTLFLQKGRKHGGKTKNGLEMLLVQAEASWEIWSTQ